MTLKWFEKSKDNKVCNGKVNIRYIEDYKQSHNKLKIPSFFLERKNILLGILRKRQRFNEIRTIKAVDNCRELVFGEIERFFEQKERDINSFLPELIIGEKSYTNILDNSDLENIYRKSENIIRNELFKRFKSLVVWQFEKTNSCDRISNIFSPIDKYQKIKKRTVSITSYIEALCRRTLSDSIESLMKNSLIAKLVCNTDISTILLPKLGINSGLETIELNEAIFNRIGGALYSIKVGLVQEMNNQIANIFYETHDLQLDFAIELKVHLLEEKIALEIHEIDLLEA